MRSTGTEDERHLLNNNFSGRLDRPVIMRTVKYKLFERPALSGEGNHG